MSIQMASGFQGNTLTSIPYNMLVKDIADNIGIIMSF